MSEDNWRVRMLYDGGCPLCTREVRFIRRRDRAGRIDFVDITDAGFDPGVYGLTHEAVMGRMHAVLPDGSIVTGMEVFRRVYREIGWGWLMAPTGWPVLRPVFDLLYRGFARVRPRLARWGGAVACDAGACEVGQKSDSGDSGGSRGALPRR